MRGYICIEIPVKPYIKAYITKELGDIVKLQRDNSFICDKLYDLLEHTVNHQRTIARCEYKEKVKVFVPLETFKRRGQHLNNCNVRSFNRFLEKLIKKRFYEIMDDLVDILPSFQNNLPEARRRLGIDLEAWSDDSMQKDYYRYRKEAGKQMLYRGYTPNYPK